MKEAGFVFFIIEGHQAAQLQQIDRSEILSKAKGLDTRTHLLLSYQASSGERSDK